MNSSVILLAALALTVSCNRINKAEKNMNAMKDKTTSMERTTSTMYQQVRSKEAEATRNEKFMILNPDQDQFGSKLAAASIYFKSLEFQLWTANNTYDNDENRDKLFLDAANEFTKRINGIYEHINLNTMSPTKTGKRHAMEVSFYAIAATMHMNHNYQEELMESKASFKGTSFYDLIKGTLRKDSVDPKHLNKYQEILVNGINKEIMIELVKARVDIMAALALKNLTDKRRMTLKQKMKAGVFELTKGKFGTIDLPETFAKSNEATKNQTLVYLDSAKKAKAFLLEIGVHKELERTIESALGQINLEDDREAPAPDQVQQQQQEESQKEDNVKKTLIKGMISDLL